MAFGEEGATGVVRDFGEIRAEVGSRVDAVVGQNGVATLGAPVARTVACSAQHNARWRAGTSHGLLEGVKVGGVLGLEGEDGLHERADVVGTAGVRLLGEGAGGVRDEDDGEDNKKCRREGGDDVESCPA